ncbi:aldehyde dehydrogenase family protein [Microbacterium schleiferi]|uniref:aldehyde dehydrogenase family protein n=1 Tax=Microbacterium schleiferi TaxID=69362 RepID=UPI00311FBD16
MTSHTVANGILAPQPSPVDPSAGHGGVRDRQFAFLVNGELRGAVGGATYQRVSPFTRDIIATAPHGDARDANLLADAADQARRGWARTPMAERAALVAKAADLVEAHAEELAYLESIDSGSSLVNSRMDVGLTLQHMRLFAGIALEVKGATIPASAGLHFTVREPVGVVLRIPAFNHPLMFAGKAFPAIVAGCPVIVKPPAAAPLSTLRLGEILRDVFPPGVLQIATASNRGLADALVRHKHVRRIAFIGSTSTGLAIQRAASESGYVKEVSLELGGKNAMVVFDDADVDAAARGAIAGMNFAWSGQSCGSNSRLLVQRGIHDRLIERIAELLKGHRMGDPLDPSTQQGTLISEAHFETVTNYIRIAQDEGARVVAGGERGDDPALGEGLFVPPTVLTDVPLNGRIAREEIFGPVLAAIPFDDADEALRIANDSEYGLTASIWTQDITRALRFARDIEAGFVWINDSAKHFPNVPYGGVKSSGFGREESMEELLSYTEQKSINVAY